MLSPSLRSFHDRVFVLTTRLNTERQKKVLDQLGEGNFEFFFGVDKEQVTKEQLIHDGIYDETLARRVDPKSRSMLIGHICCSLGHRMIYEEMIASGCRRALIFEDDVVNLGISEETIRTSLANLPRDWQLLYWDWSGGRTKPFLGGLQQLIFHARHVLGSYKYNHRMIRNSYMRSYNNFFDVSSVNFFTDAYSITIKAAEKLVRLNTPINLNADHALIHAVLSQDIKGYVSRVKLFSQRSYDPDDPLESMTQKYY
jgi:GR25 family glycosyltransferase involved in LPS biosynthesis